MATSALRIASLSIENRRNPIGITEKTPRIQWIYAAPHRTVQPASVQLQVSTTPTFRSGILWDTIIKSPGANEATYAGRPLQSHQHIYLRARIRDTSGNLSPWSDTAKCIVGILDPRSWRGKWIGFKPAETALPEHPLIAPTWTTKTPSPLLRKEFDVPGKAIRSATLYAVGLGFGEFRINGKRVSDQVLDPAFTRYDKAVLYSTFDVTKLLQFGRNAIGVMLGNGWWNQHQPDAWEFEKAPWRAEPIARAWLHIRFVDGSTQDIATDASWKGAAGPVVRDGLRSGEVYDARLWPDGWDQGGYNGMHWQPVTLRDAPRGALRSQLADPIRVTETLKPKSISKRPDGSFVIDFGQNIAGWCRLRLANAKPGNPIKLVYGERVSAAGDVTQDEIKMHTKAGPFQTDVYIPRGTAGGETYETRFAFHGFQWVQVYGLETLDAGQIDARVVHTDFGKLGDFSCSDTLLNRIQQATQWAYRSNWVGIPMDCPHREKNGWTGDAQLAIEHGLLHWKNDAGYEKWLRDIADEMQPSGEIPGIVPTGGWGYAWGNGPAWDAAFIEIPWQLYRYRGNRSVLAEHYQKMKRYVNYLSGKSKDGIVSIGLGDWLPAKTETPVDVTSTCYYTRCADIVAKTAAVLGHQEDVDTYNAVALRARKAFVKAFLNTSDGTIANGSQTSQAAALYFNMVTDFPQTFVLDRLIDAIHRADFHIDTGILGARYLFRVLSDFGRTDIALRILRQKTKPGYGWWMEQGATTLWEDFDGTASRNHIMFGDISAWFVSYLGGIRVDDAAPGMQHFRVEPMFVADINRVDAHHDSPFGRIVVNWSKVGGRVMCRVVVPSGTTADVVFPLADTQALHEGGKPVAGRLRVQLQDRHQTTLRLSGGAYTFAFPMVVDGRRVGTV